MQAGNRKIEIVPGEGAVKGEAYMRDDFIDRKIRKMAEAEHIFPGCRMQMLQRIATADRLRTAKKQAGRTEAGLSGGRIFPPKGTCHA